ncbi:glycosyltransferase family 4 protein [Sphingomonas daechungensis]|uniref:glycosyltransferase family 4 protein n=1 Tax=Sphingomonas daechungensis TaxID=1176646 RepID=UPI0037846128
MRILFALPGLHRVDRGAEVAFISVASELAERGDQVTLIGSGPPRANQPYNYVQASLINRERFERWPRLPLFRTETAWEDASFIPGLLKAYNPADFDVTVTCSYPFTNWALRAAGGRNRPAHVFVTQNGDWPAVSNRAEYRFFGCDGLVCINPDYFDRNREAYRCALIPNGVDTKRFHPGTAERGKFELPTDRPVILMVSAMIASKNIDKGIAAVSALPDALLIVAGDGPLRADLKALADERLPGRYRQITVPSADMPALYRSADAVLHLSQDESFGNVYVEAMASGVPIVAYDSPRTRWILGDEGLLGDPNVESSIKEQLAKGLDRSDKDRKRLVERASQFEWSAIAGQYRDFFSEVISKGR